MWIVDEQSERMTTMMRPCRRQFARELPMSHS
jgi:hypothetical protein